MSTAYAFTLGVFRRLAGAGLFRTAAALSFATVLAIVPLLTVAFVYVARYPLFERWLGALERFLLRYLIPGSGAHLRPYLDEFTEKAASLQGVGIAAVIVTAILMIATITREFNIIWGTRESPSWWRRLWAFAVALALGPLAIGAVVWSTNWLMERSVSVVPGAADVRHLVATPLSVVWVALTFAILYAVLPARRVPLPAALVGGAVAALVFEVAKRGFVTYITAVPTYQHVYGAVAVVPLFLVWVFVSWMVVLFGAAVTAQWAERKRR